jgi:cell wall-associated NlpC family hydrolase
MKLRRAARLRSAARPRPLRAKALTAARGQLGVKESPAGSNRVKFSAWYGLVGPWCAMFVSWAYAQAGSKLRYAYVPYIVADARAGRNGLQVVSYAQAQPGDLVCYDWDGGVADHVGLLESKHGSTFYAIEGNTSYGNDSNGGEVMRRTRRIDQVEAFVRVGR